MELESWEYWINKIPETEQLDTIDQIRAKTALFKIKKLFTQSLPDLAQTGHPIWGHYIVNDVAWTRKWFYEFMEAVEMALNQPNGRQIVDLKKKKKKFFDILFELDIGNRFKKAGFDIEFYPKSPDSEKIPDLKIKNTNTDEEFFIEITFRKRRICTSTVLSSI